MPQHHGRSGNVPGRNARGISARGAARRTLLAGALWLVASLLAAPFAPLAAQTTNQYSNTSSGTISNAATPCGAPLTRSFTVGTQFTVQDVNIGVVASHAYRGDMVMTLVSPQGTQVTFNNATGGAALNYNVLADDEAAATLASHTANDTATSSASAPPYQRTLRPSASLTVFDGQNAQGTWTLSICDTFSADDGTFFRADLYLGQANRPVGTPPVLSCPAGITSLDWDAISWTAGSTSNAYAVTNIGTVGIAITNPGNWLNNTTYGGQSPARQNVVSGGQPGPPFSLFQLVDLASQAQTVTTTISLQTAVPGLQFRIFDVDFFAGQFADRVTITGSYNGSPVTPVLTGSAANVISGNSATGEFVSSDISAEGNVTVTFAAPVDSISISYGNHTTAPADPGQQAIALHDLNFCNPQALVSLAKTSSVISDPVNGATDPKAIPGAVIRYCLLVSNAGSATATATTIADGIPALLSYVPGSLRSGNSCAGATTVEDDDAAGADESDPAGAAISGTTISASIASLPPAGALAIAFDVLVP